MKAAELRFGIVGGGPGGLLTAIALKRKGFRNIHVFERDERK
jgi:2-polyprenyl-6-methoxyphenol hydroxylase-like FAD-dependent oxidoreductase